MTNIKTEILNEMKIYLVDEPINDEEIGYNRAVIDLMKAVKAVFDSAISFDSVIEEERKKYNDIALDLLGEVEYYEKAIEDIKAEINRKANSGQWSDATVYGMKKALAIIDKHIADIRGKE